jgi:hypothetical protein
MTKKNKLTEETEKRAAPLIDFVRDVIDINDSQGRVYQEKIFEIHEENHFHLIQRTKGTEAVIKSGTSLSNNAVKQIGSTDAYLDFTDIRLIIDNFLTESENLKFSTLLSKLFTLILISISQSSDLNDNEDSSIDLDLKYIAEKIGKNIEKANKKSEFKKDLINSLELLRKMTIRIYSEKLKGKEISDEITTANILRSYTIRSKGEHKDIITINLTEEFLIYIRLGYWMPFGKSLLRIVDSGSYQFHNELNNYTSIPNNFIPRKKTTASDVQAKIFSIHTAIKWCKSIPTIEDVRASDRQYERRIIQRLESIFEEKDGLIKKWEWCKAKGKTLTETERNRLSDYEIITQLYVHVIELKNESEYLANILPATGRIIESDERRARIKIRRLNKAKNIQPQYIDK